MDQPTHEFDLKVSLSGADFNVAMLERGEEHDHKWLSLGWALQAVLQMATPFVHNADVALAQAAVATVEDTEDHCSPIVQDARMAFHKAASDYLEAHKKWVDEILTQRDRQPEESGNATE